MKMIVEDYNKYVRKEFEKARPVTNKKPFFDNFIPIFRSLMIIYHDHKFT